MKNLKNQKGITLVALVITIIVLLILAGVALSLVAGNEGILGKATHAVDETDEASIKEQVTLVVMEKVADYYETKYVNRDTGFHSKSIKDYVRDTINGETTADYTITTTPGGDDYKVTITRTENGDQVAEGSVLDNGKFSLTYVLKQSTN